MSEASEPTSAGVVSASEVAAAAVVVVTANPIPGLPARVLCIDAVQAHHVLEVAPSPVQAGQLWVVCRSFEDGLAARTAEFADLGAALHALDDPADALAVVAMHFEHEAQVQQDVHAQLRRENTALRRELNRALSALDERHPILGLLPTATIEDFAVRHAARDDVPGQPSAPTVDSLDELLVGRGLPVATEAEVLALREELRAIQQTKIMRWSRIPRRFYSGLRRLLGRAPAPSAAPTDT